MTMSKIVLNMVSLGFENVVILVFDLPAGAPIPHNGFNRGVSDFKVGDESVFVEYAPRIFTGDGRFAPLDFERRWVSVERQFVLVQA